MILGLTITSSWGNGHATTYRGLVRELARRGHDVLFLEHDKPYYAAQRDMPSPPWGRLALYGSLDELKARHAAEVRGADAVIVGSYVPQGVDVGEWAQRTARGPVLFYDIDTPVTLAKLARGDHEYLHPRLVPDYAAYLSFTGGPTLRRLERELGARRALPLYCSVDPDAYASDPRAERDLDLGYLGTYSADRQPTLDRLLVGPARRWPRGRFCVAGPMYPQSLSWPENVERVEHLPPADHAAFYNRQRFTLNVTRADMVSAGWSPSVRLFEAAACGTPIVSDEWPGLGELFELGREIVVARSPDEALALVRDMPEDERREVARRARARVLREHTSAHRARELESHLERLLEEAAPRA